jgi:hypothetical protein
MFLNHRSRRIAALVVTVFLLAALPAAAGGAATRGSGSAWEGLVARVLAWLGSPWDGSPSISSTDSGSQIDPLGQPYKAAVGLKPAVEMAPNRSR